VKKSLKDLKSSINILEENIKLFHKGNTDTYIVIAVELWKLLCDKNPLIPRVFNNVKLNPLKGYMTKEEDDEWKKKFGHSLKESLVFQSPAMISFNGKGGARIIALFDERKEPIELEEWLNQDLFNEDITIRQLIKSVRHKLGAHSDEKYNETLIFTQSIKIVDEDIHIKYIVSIGEYVLKILTKSYEHLHGGAGVPP